MDPTPELQGFSKNSGARLEEINEGSFKTKIVRLPNDSIIKVVDPLFNKHPKHLAIDKHPKHLAIDGALCLNEHLAKNLNGSESVRKKRSSSDFNRLSDTLENTPVCLGVRQKRGREQFGSLSAHSLPEEVVEEILSRLPVKSLAQFRCICKLWNHLSYSKRFVSLHLKNYRTSQLLVGTCCHVHVGSGGFCDNDGASQERVKHEFPGLLCGSCNGIVCLYGLYSTRQFVLWNPATNESKIIPKPECARNPEFFRYYAIVFGFDPKTNDYKILIMVVYRKPGPSVLKMELYSLRKDSWKKVDSHDFMAVCNDTPVDMACSLPFTDNRIVCAVVSPINEARKCEILSFDMSSEMYEIIHVHPSLDAGLGEHKSFTRWSRFFKLFPFKETIALGIVYHVENGSFCDIWMLNNFDSSIQSRSWSKYLSTNINDNKIVPVGCWGSSQILFQDMAFLGLNRLDHGNNMMVELGVFPPAYVSTTLYKESLVRIDDLKEDESCVSSNSSSSFGGRETDMEHIRVFGDVMSSRGLMKRRDLKSAAKKPDVVILDPPCHPSKRNKAIAKSSYAEDVKSNCSNVKDVEKEVISNGFAEKISNDVIEDEVISIPRLPKDPVIEFEARISYLETVLAKYKKDRGLA